MLIQGF